MTASALRLGRDQLRDPNFARLFSARFISVFGSAMTPLAVAFGVLDLTGSPKLVGLVIASQTVVQAATQLLGGALADRWSRKNASTTLTTSAQTIRVNELLVLA